jgi:DNA-damage-inducible protein J
MDNATAPITFHMNAELAANFEKACQKLGLTTSEAFTIFATNVARERRIPFEVAVDPFYSKRNIARLKKSIAQMEAIGAAVGEVDVHD